MSSENLRVHHKTGAVHKKRHFLWGLRVSATAKPKPLGSREGLVAPLAPALEACALAVLRKWHYVRVLQARWLRSIVKCTV